VEYKNMNDKTITLAELKIIATDLVQERDWQQFHTPKDLSMNLSVEANELLEKFLWISSASSFEEINKNRTEIEDEVGDILFSILRFCTVSNIDASAAFLKKIEKIKVKYPVEKVKGNYQKYTKY
jgi:dCTP diphosphatase